MLRMALHRRSDPNNMAQAFRSNHHLQKFLLTDVIATGRVLGTGSYGSVEEVSYRQIICAGKKLHEALLEVESEGLTLMLQKYQLECQLMSNLRHPNITQFLGICFLPGTHLPLLVMECLETSLDSLLEYMPDLPFSLKRSVLEDVASGLLYLHKMQPPVIHRDLTSKNVLLTSSLVAKITDMGNSIIIDLRPGQIAKTLSQVPGTLVYMPPEALDDRHRYGPSLDIFSFGHLALYTIIQKFPGNLLPSTFYDTKNLGVIRARTELERRGAYIESMESRIGQSHATLAHLIKQCLQNIPEQRPSSEELLMRLQGMRGEVEGEYGNSLVKVDVMTKLKLTKDVKLRDKRINELVIEQARSEASYDEMARQMQAQDRQHQQMQDEILAKNREIQQLQGLLMTKEELLKCQSREMAETVKHNQQLQREVVSKDQQIQAKDEHIQRLNGEMRTANSQLSQQSVEIEEKDLKLSQLQITMETTERKIVDYQERQIKQAEELLAKEAEVNRLRDQLKKTQRTTLKETQKISLKLPLQLTWRRGPDMPFGMDGYIQSVAIEGTVYVGGGSAYNGRYTVQQYTTSSEEWTRLPDYKTCDFAMAVVRNELVLVGGNERGLKSNMLGVWRMESKEWTHPYPKMSKTRSRSSAVVHNEWLVVAGGWTDADDILSSIEVLNMDFKQWSAGPSTPVAWTSMKTARVGDTCYFMGGYTREHSDTEKIFALSLSALTTFLSSAGDKEEEDSQMWKETSGPHFLHSSPLSFSSSLLAVGGRSKNNKLVAALQLYLPDTEEWVKVGELQQQLCDCTCLMITERQLLVTGGHSNQGILKRMDIALIN